MFLAPRARFFAWENHVARVPGEVGSVAYGLYVAHVFSVQEVPDRTFARVLYLLGNFVEELPGLRRRSESTDAPHAPCVKQSLRLCAQALPCDAPGHGSGCRGGWSACVWAALVWSGFVGARLIGTVIWVNPRVELLGRSPRALRYGPAAIAAAHPVPGDLPLRIRPGEPPGEARLLAALAARHAVDAEAIVSRGGRRSWRGCGPTRKGNPWSHTPLNPAEIHAQLISRETIMMADQGRASPGRCPCRTKSPERRGGPSSERTKANRTPPTQPRTEYRSSRT